MEWNKNTNISPYNINHRRLEVVNTPEPLEDRKRVSSPSITPKHEKASFKQREEIAQRVEHR
jgi:hypothetical protein